MNGPDTPNADGADSSGLAASYHVHRDELSRFLRARTGDPAEAEDIVQELWVKIAAGATGPVTNGRAYLYRMAQNLVLDRLRQVRRRGARERDWADVELNQRADGPEPSVAADAESGLIASERTARIARAVAALPPAAGRAFRLHKLAGMSHAQTAAVMGISRKGVEKHMATAFAHLRRALADEVG